MDSGGGFQGRPHGPPERQQMLTEAGAAGDAASHQAQSSRPAVHAAPAASSAAGAAAALAVRKPVPLPTDGSEFVGGARKNSKKRKTEAPLGRAFSHRQRRLQRARLKPHLRILIIRKLLSSSPHPHEN